MASIGKKLLIGAVVTVAATSLTLRTAVAVAKHLNEQNAQAEADTWLLEARQTASANMTANEAVFWLREHGASEVGTDVTRWHNDMLVEQHGVAGTRRLSKNRLWSDSKTATLYFHFDANGHFQGVDLEIYDH